MPNFIFNYKKKPEIILVRFFSILKLKDGIFVTWQPMQVQNETPAGMSKRLCFL